LLSSNSYNSCITSSLKNNERELFKFVSTGKNNILLSELISFSYLTSRSIDFILSFILKLKDLNMSVEPVPSSKLSNK